MQIVITSRQYLKCLFLVDMNKCVTYNGSYNCLYKEGKRRPNLSRFILHLVYVYQSGL